MRDGCSCWAWVSCVAVDMGGDHVPGVPLAIESGCQHQAGLDHVPYGESSRWFILRAPMLLYLARLGAYASLAEDDAPSHEEPFPPRPVPPPDVCAAGWAGVRCGANVDRSRAFGLSGSAELPTTRRNHPGPACSNGFRRGAPRLKPRFRDTFVCERRCLATLLSTAVRIQSARLVRPSAKSPSLPSSPWRWRAARPPSARCARR